jgi:hypothetical protein
LRDILLLMISLDEFRELLPEGNELSEEEILELRNALYETAQLAFDVYRGRKNELL